MQEAVYTPGPIRAQVLTMREAGMSGPQIARALGISKQRVYQHLKELRSVGLLKEDR